jgi:hypothetical protein
MSGEPAPDLAALSDLCTPWCLHVAATLRIAEHVADGVTGIDDLAAAAGCDPDALHCVLGHLVARGVFEEHPPGRFALNEAARALLDPALRLSLDLDGIGGRMAHAWATMPTWVKTGRPGYAAVFGLPFWEDLAANPAVAASFDAMIGPTGHGRPDPNFPLAGGWDSVRTVVDVGGGTGAMLAEILRARPGVRGVLVELPATVARSAEIFEAAGVHDRVTTVGQSFFDPLPPGGDLYLLRGVLNDWPDREATAILRRAAEAARPSGRVVVMKGQRAPDAPRDVMIEMVLAGGKGRTVEEFRALGRQAGLELLAAGDAAGYGVIELRPA